MDNGNNNEAKMANFRKTVLVLQIIFATATILCGAGNLFMNSRDIGFAYELKKPTTQPYPTKRPTIRPQYVKPFDEYGYIATRRPIWGDGRKIYDMTPRFRTIATTTMSPTTMRGERIVLADKFCWDNSGLWGGALVLLVVLLTVPRSKKGCYSVFQSVSGVCGLLVCTGTAVAATLWSDQVLGSMGGFMLRYNEMKRNDRCFVERYFGEWRYSDTCVLLKEFNVHFAYGIMVVTIATAIFCYLNVALFSLQLLDWFPFSYCFSRVKVQAVSRTGRGGASSCIPCGANCFLGGVVCKFGVFDADKDCIEQKNVEYKPLIEEKSSDTVDTITEPGFTN